jgi:tetratricopeptide (TPR) repeat protein
MEKNTIQSEFKISFDNDFISRQFGFTPAQEKLLKELVIRVHGKVDKVLIRKLDKLSKEHPNLPQLRNYLSTAYNTNGQYDKAIEINEQLLKDFPTYLHARINAANHCFFKGTPEKALDYLGANLDLQSLYPDRNEFHFTEVQSFYYATVLYAIAVRDLELAENRFEFYKSIDEENPRIKELEIHMENFRILNQMEMMEELDVQFCSPHGKEVPVSKKTDAPIFQHSEVNRLYELGFNNSVPELLALLQLPKESLIQDLELVLQDAIDRYHYFNQVDWSIKSHSFLHHAVFLLAELNSEKSLPKILEIISYEEDFLNLYFGDSLTEDIWIVLCKLGVNQVSLLESILYDNEIYTYAKSAVSNAICQIVMHNPERKNEIQPVYQRYFESILDDNDLDKLIDPTFLALAIGDTSEINLVDLLPLIKKMYENGFVDQSIEGDYDRFMYFYAKKEVSFFKNDLKNIEEIYQNTFYEEEIYESGSFLNDAMKNESKSQIPIVSVKINRNDPCTCGSGKKYKKCCG